MLPSATATVTQNGNIYNIAINWDDNRDGVVDGQDFGFQMSFR
jgi:hypothetical protein